MNKQIFMHDGVNAQSLEHIITKYPNGWMPNFILTNSSASIQRQCAVQLAEFIIQHNAIPFEGELKQFIMRIPYFQDVDEANKGFNHLMQSVAVAAGYYSVYCGIIILEFSETWTEKDDLHYLENVVAYIKANQGRILFLFLIPNEKKTEKVRSISLLSLLKGVVPCKEIQCKKPDAKEIEMIFTNLTSQCGWKISNTAGHCLSELMEDIIRTDNPIESVRHCVDQLQLFHYSNPADPKWITPEVLKNIETNQKHRNEAQKQRKIGFSLE